MGTTKPATTTTRCSMKLSKADACYRAPQQPDPYPVAGEFGLSPPMRRQYQAKGAERNVVKFFSNSVPRYRQGCATLSFCCVSVGRTMFKALNADLKKPVKMRCTGLIFRNQVRANLRNSV
jgi:hypothetical protein